MKLHQTIRLKQKGWSEAEIRKAERILEEERRYDAHFSKIVFWTSLILVILANIVVSVALIPFLLVFPAWLLYAVVILLAGSIGFLYDLLIRDIGHLEQKHHILASIILPIIALLNIVAMVLMGNKFIADTNVTTQPHDPWVISILFALAFILPYILHQFKYFRK